MSYGGPNERWPWALDEETSRPFIKRALELGINFFDTANVYSNGRSEEIVGKALRDLASRDEVVIATKVFFEMGPGPNDRGLSRKHILSSIDASLRCWIALLETSGKSAGFAARAVVRGANRPPPAI
jgi:aryl-alcohol dehydrogenase-like predicted oxidoreductase